MKTPVNYTLVALALPAISTLNPMPRRNRVKAGQRLAKGACLLALALLSTLNFQPSTFAQGTAFTYQGQLQNNGSPASGAYNLTFSLYTNSTGGTAVAGPVTNNAVAVSNGLFTVLIDFGPGVFTGATNWLEIGVETNGGGSFTTLTPRQQLSPAPYAIYAEGANAAGLSGTIPMASLSGTYGGAVNLTNAGNSFSGNGAGLTGVNAAALNGLNATNFWQTAGNSGTSPTNGNFLGTTDFQPLELKAGGMRVLRLEPDPRTDVGGVSGNLIGGFTNNLIEKPESGGDFIGGGGYPAGPNVIHSNSSGVFIGAGSANQVGPNVNDAVIGGGYGNTIQSPDSVVVGGYNNTIRFPAYYATIGGGAYNSIGTNCPSATISGGYSHTIGDNTYDATIGGGSYHTIGTNSYYSTIGGGRFNAIGGNSTASTIAGGFQDTIQNGAGYASIGGGYQNNISGSYAVVPGGYFNSAIGAYSFAAGNQAQANHDGAFVWSDATGSGFSSSGTNQFLIHASGGVGINTNNPAGAALNVAGTVRAISFQGDGSGLTNLVLVTSGNYVFAYSMALQTVTPFTFQNATFNNDAQLNGWTHTLGDSRYFCTQTGLYLIQYTAEAYIADSMSMRGALNFIEIPGSQAYASPVNFGPTVVISKSFLASVNSGSFLTIQFTGNSASDNLQGGGSGSFQPSISLTITRIQ